MTERRVGGGLCPGAVLTAIEELRDQGKISGHDAARLFGHNAAIANLVNGGPPDWENWPVLDRLDPNSLRDWLLLETLANKLDISPPTLTTAITDGLLALGAQDQAGFARASPDVDLMLTAETMDEAAAELRSLLEGKTFGLITDLGAMRFEVSDLTLDHDAPRSGEAIEAQFDRMSLWHSQGLVEFYLADTPRIQIWPSGARVTFDRDRSGYQFVVQDHDDPSSSA